MLYHCPYCGWQGSEPNIAEYPENGENKLGEAKMAIKIGTMTVDSEESLPVGNAFNGDSYRMGSTIGSNVTVMFEKFDHEVQHYIVICNTKTGERIRVRFQDCNNCDKLNNQSMECGGCGGRLKC